MKTKKIMRLSEVVKALDDFFRVENLEKDPAMSHFVPIVYKNNWKELEKNYELDYLKHFNGLMIKGAEIINTVYTASFPHDEILQKFILQSTEGDLLFLHHPIPLECGDPKGKLGRGFLPNNPRLIRMIQSKKLSVYVCHAPLDYNEKISTNRAIVKALNGKVESTFLPYGNGDAGIIAKIDPISTDKLIAKLMKIFDIPYVDFAGVNVKKITKVGIVAGGGDEVEYSQISKKKGAQAYITGEVYSRQESEWAKQNTAKLNEYVTTVDMSLIGVSHAASEFLVMRTQIKEWFKKNFNTLVIPIGQSKWWI